MIYYRTFFLLLLVLLVARVSFEDWTQRKIRNHWIKVGLWCCAVGYGLWLTNSLLGLNGLHPFGFGYKYFHLQFYGHVLFHGALGMAAGLVLWYMRIWPAGDAKLFMLICLWIPLVDPSLRAFPNILFLLILFNTFMFAAAYVCLSVFVNILGQLAASPGWPAMKETGRRAIDNAMEPLRWARDNPRTASFLALETLCLFLAMQVANGRLGGVVKTSIRSEVAAELVLFALWNGVSRFLSNRAVGTFLALSFVSYSIIGFSFFPTRLLQELLNAARMLASFGIILMVGRMLLDIYFRKVDVVRISITDLEPGMILADDEIRALSRDQDLFKMHLGSLYSDGLTPEQVNGLRAWSQRTPTDRVEVAISRAYPYAVWIYVGTLFTLATRQDMFQWLGLASARIR